MSTQSGFLTFELEFDRAGKPVSAAALPALAASLASAQITDLLVMSHGWNNDMAEARTLYADWLKSARQVIDQGAVTLGNRKVAFLGVLWPSKRFADRDLIPGGAASLGEGPLDEELAPLEALLDAPEERAALAKLRAASLVLLGDDANAAEEARSQFIDALRDLTPRDADDSEGTALYTDPADALFLRARDRVGNDDVDEGGAADLGAADDAGSDGGAADLGGFFRGALDAARNLLNLGTYYTMKARAGAVGSSGLQPALISLCAGLPSLRIHLIGHSFGGRLVTACVDGPAHLSTLRPASMTLLQAAYSHSGLSPDLGGGKPGFFRHVVGRIAGPTLITHTHNDRAVGLAYPIASRLAKEDASALGDENDRFGGMGRNGAQHTPEAIPLTLLPVGGAYAFAPQKIYNLEGSAFISSHGDVAGPEVAYATLRAVTS